MLDPHRLRVFRSVVASGSVRAAAANLGYTPSAVSQQLTTLQLETGLTLVERSGRGIRPTAAGLALAAEADAVLARLSEADVMIADLRSGRTGSLSIGYFASVGAAWLPAVVRRLTADYPTLRLDLRLREILPDDHDDRADIQIVVDRGDLTAEPGFTSHPLLDDPYVVVLRDDHPLAHRSEIELAELSGDRWVDNDVARGWCRRAVIDACTAAGFAPPFHVEAHDYLTAIAFVAAGIGVTVLPALGAASLPDGVRAIAVVRPAPVRSISALVRDAVARTPAARAALETLRDVAARAESSLPVGTAR